MNDQAPAGMPRWIGFSPGCKAAEPSLAPSYQAARVRIGGRGGSGRFASLNVSNNFSSSDLSRMLVSTAIARGRADGAAAMMARAVSDDPPAQRGIANIAAREVPVLQMPGQRASDDDDVELRQLEIAIQCVDLHGIAGDGRELRNVSEKSRSGHAACVKQRKCCREPRSASRVISDPCRPPRTGSR